VERVIGVESTTYGAQNKQKPVQRGNKSTRNQIDILAAVIEAIQMPLSIPVGSVRELPESSRGLV